jgi:Fe-S-cluster containining protein
MSSNGLVANTNGTSVDMNNFKQLKRDDKFCFSCKKEYSCFNQCCTDTNIFLTPYDVLRIRHRLNISSEDFLEEYTIQPFNKDQKLPVVVLRMMDDDEKCCQFVKEEGCSIYEDRPWSCRMYPIGLASQKTRSEDPGNEFYFLQEDEFCEGHTSKQEWTIDAWIKDQGIEPYEHFSSLYREIVLHPYFEKGQDLSPRKMEMFHLVFYNLDKFRKFVFDSTFLQRFEIAKETVAAIKNDDMRLMRFGVDWLKFCLFGEDTIKIRGDVTEDELAEA